jgi:uncharacterized protein YecT (DUF1311 family)
MSVRDLCRAGALLAAVAWVPGVHAAAADTLPKPVAIEFARGASSGRVHGGVARGEVAYYRFGAAEGQWADVALHSVEDNAVVTLFEPGWRLVPAAGGIEVEGDSAYPMRAPEAASGWSGVLEESGEYLVVVGTVRGGAEFDLELTIEAPTEEHCGELAQQPMNHCTGALAANLERERVKAERALAAVFGADREGVLRAAEASWKAYRDAQCTLEASSFEGGSMQPTIYNSCVVGLLRARIEAVRRLAESEGL